MTVPKCEGGQLEGWADCPTLSYIAAENPRQFPLCQQHNHLFSYFGENAMAAAVTTAPDVKLFGVWTFEEVTVTIFTF